MTFRSRTQKLLSILLPAGVLGVSAALASAHAKPVAAASDGDNASQDTADLGVAARLQAIRSSFSALEGDAADYADDDPRSLLAQWVNFGGGGAGWRNAGPWRNGGWGNIGPWRNGGWVNAGPWRNGGWGNAGPWRNGGWGNAGPWRNGGWNNFWRNW